MLKNILKSINEVVSFIAVVSGITLSVIEMLTLGTHAVALIAICSLILSIGLSITLKMMVKKEEDNE